MPSRLRSFRIPSVALRIPVPRCLGISSPRLSMAFLCSANALRCLAPPCFSVAVQAIAVPPLSGALPSLSYAFPTLSFAFPARPIAIPTLLMSHQGLSKALLSTLIRCFRIFAIAGRRMADRRSAFPMLCNPMPFPLVAGLITSMSKLLQSMRIHRHPMQCHSNPCSAIAHHRRSKRCYALSTPGKSKPLLSGSYLCKSVAAPVKSSPLRVVAYQHNAIACLCNALASPVSGSLCFTLAHPSKTLARPVVS